MGTNFPMLEFEYSYEQIRIGEDLSLYEELQNELSRLKFENELNIDQTKNERRERKEAVPIRGRHYSPYGYLATFIDINIFVYIPTLIAFVKTIKVLTPIITKLIEKKPGCGIKIKVNDISIEVNNKIDLEKAIAAALLLEEKQRNQISPSSLNE